MFRRTTLISLTALLCGLGSSEVQADMTCTKAPDCASLGYNQTEAECASKPSLKCPFDTSKYYCKQTPVVEGCTVGSYLYTDRSCSSTLDKSRTLVGMVFDPVKKLAVNVKVYKDGSRGLDTIDVPFAQITPLGMEYCSPANALIDCGIDGKENSKKLGLYKFIPETPQPIDMNGINPSPLMPNIEYQSVVNATNIISFSSYTKNSTVQSSIWYGYGHWFIPSRKELQTIFDNYQKLFNSQIDSEYTFVRSVSSTLNDHQTLLGILANGNGTSVSFSGSYSNARQPVILVINYGETSAIADIDLTNWETLRKNVSNSNYYLCAYHNNGTFMNACPGYFHISQSVSCSYIQDNKGGYSRYRRWCDNCNQKFFKCCTSVSEPGCFKE